MLSEHPVFPILLSTDLAASRAFYHEVLGLETVRVVLAVVHQAHEVRPRRRLDLHDGRAVVREVAGGDRSGRAGAELEHADAVEDPRHR